MSEAQRSRRSVAVKPTRSERLRVEPFMLPRTHAIFAGVLANAFVELRLTGALTDGVTWYPIHNVPDVLSFELAHGVEARRSEYNSRMLDKIRRTGKPELGEHNGFFDLFVPIVGRSSGWGALVTGPFLLARSSGSEIVARYSAMTGGTARASDPEFLHYLSMTLDTTTLSRAELATFQRLLRCMTEAFAEHANPDRLGERASALSDQLGSVRFAERMWDTARGLIDERTTRGWSSQARSRDLLLVGLEQVPAHVVVGLLLGRSSDEDPIDDLVRRDAFQRACVDFVKRRGDVITGRTGTHTMTLLVDDDTGSGPRLKAKLTSLGQSIAALAREFGLRLCLGIADVKSGPTLPARFQAALAVAERALSRGESIAVAERSRLPSAVAGANPLGELRRRLARSVVENPSRLSPEFDRYIELVCARSGYRLEPVRAHLEAGFERICDALADTGAIDARGLEEFVANSEREAARANTVSELAQAYRSAVADAIRAALRPKEARQDRSIRRAIAYIHDHLSEPLSLSGVSRVAGFAPGYFSKLFVKSERVTFHEYTRRLRVERAKQMLVTTALSVERVGQLSGFRTRNRFYEAFRRSLQLTPHEFRARSR